jgi:hypothetical protein
MHNQSSRRSCWQSFTVKARPETSCQWQIIYLYVLEGPAIEEFTSGWGNVAAMASPSTLHTFASSSPRSVRENKLQQWTIFIIMLNYDLNWALTVIAPYQYHTIFNCELTARSLWLIYMILNYELNCGLTAIE